jgi:hypothetical protein
MMDLDALADELEEFAPPEKKSKTSVLDERVVAGFEEINRFFEVHNRRPDQSEGRDIFERIYATRLAALSVSPEYRALLQDYDAYNLLTGDAQDLIDDTEINVDDIEAALKSDFPGGSISELRHVRPNKEIRAAEEIASRTVCEDFVTFEPLFERVEKDLKEGVRTTLPFGKDTSIEEGNYFILGGILVYVAEVGDLILTAKNEKDARLRVIFRNGTESNMLMRSLQRGLYKDHTTDQVGRRVTEPDCGPLFRDGKDDGDEESGTIYVLRSKSNHPDIEKNRNLLHKIGVTGGEVKDRIANAENEATFLLAEVEVVASYALVGINRVKMESLIHKIFAPAKQKITITDRFGKPVQPQEWFLVPLSSIEKGIDLIKSGAITEYVYDPAIADFKKIP